MISEIHQPVKNYLLSTDLIESEDLVLLEMYVSLDFERRRLKCFYHEEQR